MTDYFVDYTNGNNANTGRRYTGNTVDSHGHVPETIVCAGLHGYTISNGSFVWDETAGAGALTTGWDDVTHTITLAGAIAGIANGDTFTLITPYQTILAFTSAARTAGDNCYLRTQASHIPAADITVTSAGSYTARINVIGCSTATSTDYWHDGTTTRATIDFNNAAFQWVQSTSLWSFTNIYFYNNSDTNGLIYGATTSNGMHLFTNCKFKQGATATHGVFLQTHGAEFVDCDFDGMGASKYCIYADRGSRFICRNCTFDATTNATDRAIYASAGSRVYCYNCTFGASDTFTSADVAVSGGTIWLDSCDLNSAAATYGTVYCVSADGRVYSENDQQVYGAHKTWGYEGTVEKDTASARPGGASSCAKILTNSGGVFGALNPMLIGGRFPAKDFAVWCPASETTVTIYIKGIGAWGGTYPTASELWIDAIYVSNAATGAKSTSTASTQVISDDTTWVAFTTTFTPAAAGFAYINFHLTKYVAACGAYVDIKPVVT